MNTNPGAALDSTRKMASDAMDRTSEKLRGLRSSMSDGATAAQRQLGEYAQGTMRYVGDHPMKTALIAAVGAAVAGLVIALRRQNNDLY